MMRDEGIMQIMYEINTLPGSSSSKFHASVNKDILEINALIQEFNKVQDKLKQITILKDIYRYKQKMDNKYSDIDISASNEYQNAIQFQLFNQIKEQFKVCGIPSLCNLLNSNPDVSEPPNSLAEIIANMGPSKAKKLLEILSEGAAFDRNMLIQLYQSTDPEYHEYQDFLGNNAINFLGGGNSLNFMVTPTNGTPPYVLKIENRLGMPKEVADYLNRHSLKNILTNVLVERKITGFKDGYFITRNIIITEFCNYGDLVTQSASVPKEQKIELALNIYTQMAHILLNVAEDKCAFTDMKNSNWLLDSKGKLRLADTKSFIPTGQDGFVIELDNESAGYGLAYSAFMHPPDFNNTIFSADNVHSFMLGKNLYQYLTDCDSDYLYDKNSSSQYSFDSLVFQTSAGKKLKHLITELINPNPNARLTMKQIIERLEDISVDLEKNHELIREQIACLEVLQDIKRYNTDLKSTEINTYIHTQEQKIDSATDLSTAYKDLTMMLQKIKMHHDVELDKVKRQCLNSLNTLALYKQDVNANDLEYYISKQTDTIKAATSLDIIGFIRSEISSQLNILQQKYPNIVNNEKNRCANLLAQLQNYKLNYYAADIDAYIKKQLSNISSAQGLDDLMPIQTDITASLASLYQKYTEAVAIEKAKCRSLLVEIESYKTDDFDNKMMNYITQQTQNINQSVRLENLALIKQDLTTKLPVLQKLAFEVYTNKKNICQNLLEEIKSYKLGEHDEDIMQYIIAKEQIIKMATLSQLTALIHELNKSIEIAKDRYLLQPVKRNCIVVLEKIKTLSFSEDDAYINADTIKPIEDKIKAINSTRDAHVMKQELETFLLNAQNRYDMVLVQEKEICVSLLHQIQLVGIKSKNIPGNFFKKQAIPNQTNLNSFLNELYNKIYAMNDFNQLEEIKEELTQLIPKKAHAREKIEQVNDENQLPENNYTKPV